MPEVETLSRRQPLVLVVEDRPQSLRKRRRLFESFNCSTLGVLSDSKARFELSQVPRVDMVVTDIHMPEGKSDPKDKSGVQLAKYIHEHFSGVPVAGYSSYFAEDELSKDERDVFDIIFPRGALTEVTLTEQVSKCVALAVAARESRLVEIEEELELLRRRYEVTVGPVDVLRRLAIDPDGPSEGIEGPLAQAGYKIRLVQPNGFARPLVLWVNSDDEAVHAEAYGYPDLYAFGHDENEALSAIAELILLLARDAEFDVRPAALGISRVDAYISHLLGKG